MWNREMAALRTTVIFCWPTGGIRPLGRPFSSPSSSLIGVQLHRKEGWRADTSLTDLLAAPLAGQSRCMAGAVNRRKEAQHAPECRQETPAHLSPLTAKP